MRKTGKEILDSSVTNDERHAWLATATASELSDFLRWVKADNSWALHGRDALNVVLARENIKLQKAIRNLTIWIFVLTFVMVILGIFQVYPNFKNLYSESIVSHIFSNKDRLDIFEWHKYNGENCEVWGKQRKNVEVISHGWKAIENADVKKGYYDWGWEVTLKIKEAKDEKKYLLGIEEIEYTLFDKDQFKLISNTSRLDDQGRVIWDSGEIGPVLQEAGVTKTYRGTGEATRKTILRAVEGRCRIKLD